MARVGEGGICNVLLDVFLLCYFCLTNIYLGLLDYEPFRVMCILARLLVSPSVA